MRAGKFAKKAAACRLNGTGGKKSMICGCLAALVFSLFNHGTLKAAEGQGPSFCVVIPPDVKKAAQERGRGAAAFATPLVKAAENKKKTFFSGKSEKIGFGAPDCFAISGQNGDEASMEANPGHVDSASYFERNRLAKESKDFFPNAGYYSRSSVDGSKALAIGVGLGANEDPWQAKAAKPEAKVGLMIGFGF
jgi:hypothetical protein